MGQHREPDDLRQQLIRLQRTVAELEHRNRTVSDRNSTLEMELRRIQTLVETEETAGSGGEGWYGDDTPLGNEIVVVRGGINEL